MSFRRGACPALSAPMLTGDGLLVRLATAGASLTPAQLSALCAAAERHGNGLVEITARGNFQIRGLTAESAAALADDIAALQLGLRDGVPVETNPLAGLDPTETTNAAPLAAAIREALDATDLKSRLAPKVSIIVDGGGRIGLPAVAADIRFDAVSENDWLVSIGGDASTASRLGICHAGDVTEITLPLLELTVSTGREGRGRDIPAEKAFVELGELVRPAGISVPAQEPASPFGHIHLGGDRFAFGVGLPFGQIDSAELSTFASTLENLGISEFRMSPGRALLALGAGNSAGIAERAKAAGYVVSPDDPRARIFACPGSAGCASGHFAAREIAASVARELNGTARSDIELHISGCPKGCAHPTPAALTLIGTEQGPALVKNGTARQPGIPFGDQDVARRLLHEMRSHSSAQHRRRNGQQPQPAHAFAGE
jgi:precorrin-3B synthase